MADLANRYRDNPVTETVDYLADDQITDAETGTLASAMKVACTTDNGYQMSEDWLDLAGTHYNPSRACSRSTGPDGRGSRTTSLASSMSSRYSASKSTASTQYILLLH